MTAPLPDGYVDPTDPTAVGAVLDATVRTAGIEAVTELLLRLPGTLTAASPRPRSCPRRRCARLPAKDRLPCQISDSPLARPAGPRSRAPSAARASGPSATPSH